MSAIVSEETGSAPTLASLNDAKALRPASLLSSDEQLPPDNTSGDQIALEGADLLDRIHAFVLRFICYPSESASIAHVLWIAHTHLMDVWFSTPRMAVLSPEPGSGKSRFLEITSLLVCRALLSVQSSAAYILRKIADQGNRPTILFDEIDAIFGPNGRPNEDLRSMINSGYRRGATTGRCYTERGKVLTQELPTYGAIAMGGLGDLPHTIMDRSIVIRMRKRAAGEMVEPFRPTRHEAEGQCLHDALAAWAEGIEPAVDAVDPVVPEGISDRNADVWLPLLVIAELAGGSWPDMARATALEFVNAAKMGSALSLGGELLVDIHRCFEEADRLPTGDLLDRLLADDEAPWGDLRGKKIDARKLAGMLKPFGIKSTSVRMQDGSTPKGYMREAFYDAWKRYLPPPAETATSATSDTGPD